jgi:hypothetical protein
MFAKSFILLAISASAFANVFITSPTASTTFTAGQKATITWQDDSKAPSLKDFGPAKVSIYVGNAQQQTSLQTVVPSVDVSTTSSVEFTPDGGIGPNSDEYFIRIESLSLKDPKQPQFPALAFSAKFKMAGMTGKFSDDIQRQIDGQSTAPLAGQTSAPASSGSATASATTTKATSSGSATGSSTKSSASATSTGNSAVNVKAGWFGALLGAVIGVAMF